MKFLRIATLAAFAGILLAPAVHADNWTKKTVLTVTEAVRVPSCCSPDHSVTLQPGKYTILLMDSLSDRHIVRILGADGTTVITTILAIPNYRLKATSKTAFQYWEVPAGQVKAMRAWFYPGDNFGQEFAYPKDAAVEIAAFVKAPVPAMMVAVKNDDELKTASIAVVQPTGDAVEPVKVQAYVTPAPMPAAAEPTPAPAVAETATALPATGSEMPLISLIGLALSSAGVVVARFRRKS